LLHRHRIVVLLANLIGEALAAASLDRAAVITALALHIYHRLGVFIPLVLHGLKAFEAVDLLRVIGHQFLQIAQVGNDARLSHFVWVEEMLVAGNQETTHAGFQVHGELGRLVKVIDYPIGVLNPLDHR